MAFFESFAGMFILAFVVFAFIDGAYAVVYGRRTSRAVGVLLLILGIIGAFALVSSMFGSVAWTNWEIIKDGVASILGAIVGLIVATLILLVAVLKA